MCEVMGDEIFRFQQLTFHSCLVKSHVQCFPHPLPPLCVCGECNTNRALLKADPIPTWGGGFPAQPAAGSQPAGPSGVQKNCSLCNGERFFFLKM